MDGCSRPLVKDLRIESVVASVDPLGNPEHDQMNQQRQLIARRGRLGKASRRRQPSLVNVWTTNLSGCPPCTLPCQAIDHPPREFLDTIYVSWFTKLFTERWWCLLDLSFPLLFFSFPLSFLQGIISLTFSTSCTIFRVVDNIYIYIWISCLINKGRERSIKRLFRLLLYDCDGNIDWHEHIL